MKLKKNSVSFKIIIPIAVLLVTTAAALIIAPNKVVRERWYNYSLEVVGCDVDIVMNSINTESEHTLQIANAISRLLSTMVRTGFSSEAVNYACNMAVNQLGVDEISIYDKNRVRLSPASYTRSTADLSCLDDAYKGKIKTEAKVTLSKDFLIVSDVPIVVNGEIFGVVEIGTNIGSDSFISQFPDTVGCEFTIIQGQTLIHTTIAGQQGTAIKDEVYETLRKGERWEGLVDINGESYTAVYWPYDGMDDVYLFVSENTEEINVTTQEITSFISMVEIIANILILIIFGVLIYMFVLRPLRKTGEAIDGLSSGDADLTYRLPVQGNDEFAQLSSGVNKFIDLLQNMMKELFSQSGEINSVIGELNDTAQETASITTEIMANIESVKNQTDAVSNAVDIIGVSNGYMADLKHNIVAQTA